ERRLIGRVYPGNRYTGQPFLHLDDLTDALLKIVERREELPPELPLLLAESEVLDFNQIQRRVSELIHGEAWKTREVPATLAKAGAWVQDEVLDEDPFIRPWMVDIANDHYEIDTSRAEKLLDWRPVRSLSQTLPKMVSALKADPVGWYRTNKLNPARVAAKTVEAAAGKESEGASPAHEGKMREHMEDMRSMHFGMLWVHYLN